MKKRYQIDQQRAVQKFRRLATEENPNIQMILPMADIVGMLQDGVGHLLREARWTNWRCPRSVDRRGKPFLMVGSAARVRGA